VRSGPAQQAQNRQDNREVAQVEEIRISFTEIVNTRYPTLHPWLWEKGKTAKDVVARYEDIRTNEIVLVVRD
jgi:hypothetical protein